MKVGPAEWGRGEGVRVGGWSGCGCGCGVLGVPGGGGMMSCWTEVQKFPASSPVAKIGA